MDRKEFFKNVALGALAVQVMPSSVAKWAKRDTASNLKGPFKPDWDSLAHYETPEWYKNAKFGIWAHWGAQCEPEDGDWYARYMYAEGTEQYKEHLKQYGHPSKSGFKDVIHQWKAEKWNPEELVSLYKKAGAQYFMAMANHHDNFDNYNSKYQPWNSVNLGPKKDIIGGWAKAARSNNLPFGVSVHASHAWRWYETAQMSDFKGPLKGVPYDGNLTKGDGAGKWWEGYDPQALYAQNHPLSKNSRDLGSIHSQWAWGNGASIPSQDYCQKFYNRTIDLIDKYDPDVLYFDDTVLPLYPVSDVGLRIASHFYNKSIDQKGQLEAVLTGKILDEQQRECMVWDIERGKSNTIQPFVWQTDTCIGNWHYDRKIYKNHSYKDTKTVIQSLVDIVSKNGNLLLNIPVRGNGTIDPDERKIVEGIAKWTNLYGESIFGTRPWDIFGEGPAQKDAAPLKAQGFNEGKGKPFSTQDIRFTQKGDHIYAIIMEWPSDNNVLVKSLGTRSEHAFGVQNIELLGRGKMRFQQRSDGVAVQLPANPKINYAVPLRIS